MDGTLIGCVSQTSFSTLIQKATMEDEKRFGGLVRYFSYFLYLVDGAPGGRLRQTP